MKDRLILLIVLLLWWGGGESGGGMEIKKMGGCLWWGGMKNGEVEILLYGEDLGLWDVSVWGEGIFVKERVREENGNYLLV